jgi:hypothetical protein
MSTVTANQNDIFARTLDIRGERLSTDVARFFLDLELSPDDQTRLNELAEKARQGTLSANETRDLDEYRRVGRLVELMKLKASIALRSA